MNRQELLSVNANGINLFDACRDEALTYYLPIPDFRKKILLCPARQELMQIMLETDYSALILNMSAAWSWCDFWKETLAGITNHTWVMIFSGAQIYNRTLLETLKTHPSTPLLIEHFFTGNEYYLEEKYEPIPNNSNMRYANYYNSLISDESDSELNRLRIKAINKIILSRNKNVKQPDFAERLPSNGLNVITIIGQVVNDFSVICTATNYLSTTGFYTELLERLLNETDCFIVFKAHPWERHKNNINSALTYNELNEYVLGLPVELQERIYLTEDFNLHELMKQSTHILTLCSQSALEAAFAGLKPVQFGNAFYGGRTFTYDFENISDFIHEYNAGELCPYLTLDEYDNFEMFLVRMLEKNLISVFNSGVLSLEKKLFLMPSIPLATPERLATHVTADVTSSSPKISPAVQVIKSKEPHSESPLRVLCSKKLAKFRRDPKKFLIDSKYRILNIIGNAMY